MPYTDMLAVSSQLAFLLLAIAHRDGYTLDTLQRSELPVFLTVLAPSFVSDNITFRFRDLRPHQTHWLVSEDFKHLHCSSKTLIIHADQGES